MVVVSVFVQFFDTKLGDVLLRWPWGIGGVAGHGLSPTGGFSSFFRFFGVFFGMMRRRLHLKVKIRSSPFYPCSGGASSIDGGLCSRRISWDSFGFRVRWCGFKSVSSNLRLSSLATVVALVRWFLRP
jgi:hypothetical protein